MEVYSRLDKSSSWSACAELERLSLWTCRTLTYEHIEFPNNVYVRATLFVIADDSRLVGVLDGSGKDQLLGWWSFRLRVGMWYGTEGKSFQGDG
jgi:hypothetical protein